MIQYQGIGAAINRKADTYFSTSAFWLTDFRSANQNGSFTARLDRVDLS